MITEKELQTVNLSASKKDFYQLWGELLDIAKKLSDRWDPTSTNESDPGIVLLKVLTAISDKLNYNIDKNILEAFMPSAAQRESMMKLCSMMGYTMKYYTSARTTVEFTYVGDGNNLDDPVSLPVEGLTIPRFTNIFNTDKTINYVTLDNVTLTSDTPRGSTPCIEGQLVECENNNNNIITINELDDNFRYYLPESSIAENGIFVYNISSDGINITEKEWVQTKNLNTETLNTRCYQFGFDSSQQRPYIEFPEDIAQLILGGLKIYYIRTSGINGNITQGTLTSFQPPVVENNTDDNETGLSSWSKYQDVDNMFKITNINSGIGGTNPETIDSAYENYKKTIGTFDTLITCRDYMNKIYSLLDDDERYPLVSNVLVTDIRDDINTSYTLCTYSDQGLLFSERAKKDSDSKDKIDQFTLRIYPFNTYKVTNKDSYLNSFKPSDSNAGSTVRNTILTELKDQKTISHHYEFINNSFTTNSSQEIYCIKNYLRLNMIITTNARITAVEEELIKTNIKKALYDNFNMRKLDFGEEIPFETLLSTIEKSDNRIKSVVLEEPALRTAFMLNNGREYDIVSAASGSTASNNINALYDKMVLNNVLAGRVALFNYDTEFKPEYDESSYDGEVHDLINNSGTGETPVSTKPSSRYPDNDTALIYSLHSYCKIPFPTTANSATQLTQNEVVSFRAPNYKTSITYPAYVNYFVKLNIPAQGKAIPAEFVPLPYYVSRSIFKIENLDGAYSGWRKFANNVFSVENGKVVYNDSRFGEIEGTIDKTKFKSSLNNYGAIYAVKIENGELKIKYYYIFDKDTYRVQNFADTSENIEDKNIDDAYADFAAFAGGIYYFQINSGTFSEFKSLLADSIQVDGETNKDIPQSIYYSPYSGTYGNGGYLIDANGNKYKSIYDAEFSGSFISGSKYKYYIPKTKYVVNVAGIGGANTLPDEYFVKNNNGLGRDASFSGIESGTEYMLGEGEYLLINYTKNNSTTNTTNTNSDTEAESSEIINKVYGPGTVLKPNFNLQDSTLYYNSHSYTKLSGSYTFINSSVSGVNLDKDPDGMFTLGVKEQIEIKVPSQISFGGKDETGEEIKDNNISLYWILKNPNAKWREEISSESSFSSLNDNNLNSEENNFTHRYIYDLQPGEYLYYTDKYKTSLAYYGAGTELVLYKTTGGASKDLSWNGVLNDGKIDETPSNSNNIIKDTVTSEDILTQGISVVPFKVFSFNSSRKLVIREYRYINLTSGDSIKLGDDFENTSNINEITSDWSDYLPINLIKNLKLNISGSTTLLPELKLNFDKDDDNSSWQVSSKLNLNVGPQVSQTLTERDFIELTGISKEKYDILVKNSSSNISEQDTSDNITAPINFRDDNDILGIKLTAGKINNNVVENLTIKCNYPIQTTQPEVYLFATDTNNYIKVDDANIPNFKIEIVGKKDIRITKADDATEDNSIDPDFITLTDGNIKFSTTKLLTQSTNTSTDTDNPNYTKKAYLPLHINLPTSATCYGILMIYYLKIFPQKITENNANIVIDNNNSVYIKSSSTENDENSITIFSKNNSWWDNNDNIYSGFNIHFDEEKANSNYLLRPGINIIKVSKSTTLQIYPGNSSETLVISPLDIVKITDNHPLGFNPILMFNSEDNAILNEIKNQDINNEFYYNCPIVNSTALTFNNNGGRAVNMKSPAIWFDPNNICNNFVISEIDANALDKDGIKFSSSSKLFWSKEN